MDTYRKVEGYAEQFFHRTGRTDFPTVRQVALAFKMCQSEVRNIVEGDPNTNMMLTSYWEQDALGDHFVEVINPVQSACH